MLFDSGSERLSPRFWLGSVLVPAICTVDSFSESLPVLIEAMTSCAGAELLAVMRVSLSLSIGSQFIHLAK